MEMKHFAHQHPLTLLNEEEERYCFGCRKPILFSTTGPSCICKTCNSFRLHKSCAELPSKIHRIAHPDHPLTICRGMRNCSACHLIRGEIMYECRDKVYCMFCALFPETIEHTSHEHPLILQMKESRFICDACDRSEQGMSYHCASCIFSISGECSSLPTTFQYNCHHHPLTLVGMFRLDEELSKFRIDCDICRRKVKESSCVYHCAKCLYVAHVGCATKGLNGSEGSEDKGQDHSPGNETSHKKAVEAHSPENSSTILCMPAPDRSGFLDMITHLVEQMSLLGSDKSGKCRGINLNHCIYINQQCISDKHSFVFDAPSDEICDGCVLPISAPYYNCPECHLILHKSCGDLPGEIHGHQLHKEHPLTLRNLQLFDCSACKETRTGFAFHCNTCSFYLDIKCSSLPAAIKHEAHEHVLNLQQSFSSMCAACHNCSIDSNVYTCIPCNFNLHKRCALLPRTLAHRYDKHALILKYTPVGLSSNEYYCEICEESVNPKCWFYYCRDCDYSFDPFCICKASQIIHENVKIGTKVIVYQHPCPLTSVLKRYQERWQCNNCRHQNGDVYLECKECEFKLDTFCALKSITYPSPM